MLDKNLIKEDSLLESENETPVLYTQRAILGFAMLFSNIFGAVLLMSNIKEKRDKWIVLGYGILYTLLTLSIVNNVPRSTGLTVGINTIGTVFMNYLFWDRYIGADTKYRHKAIKKPLIISCIIATPFVVFAIMEVVQK